LYYYPAYSQDNNNNTNLVFTDGIASGDVTDHSVVVWARANTQAQMHVQYDTDSSFSNTKSDITVPANETTDFTGHVKLEGLKPDILYYYRIWFSSPSSSSSSSLEPETKGKSIVVSNSIIGSFKTAPDHLTSKSLSFIIAGDLGGQNYCRRVDMGYPIFSVMKALSPDFFVFNGDQIYGDIDCSAKGPNGVIGWKNIPGNFSAVTDQNISWTNLAQLQDVYNKHWEYNRADAHLQSLLRNTSIYSQADDHEVINDYGGQWSYWTNATKNRAGFPNLVKAGIDAFFNFSPIDRNKENPNHIYRSFNWGKDLELFILDGHSYRSRSDIIDTPVNNKTLLGKEQLQWLKRGLLNSTATWKVISTDTPVTIPSCFTKELGCDNWATNSSAYKRTFVSERSDFLNFLDDHNIKNIVFITTDVHFPTNIVVEEDPNHDGHNLIFHEIVSGPISAIPVKASPPDPTINATALYSENQIFNFGHLKVQRESDGKVHLVSDIIDENGLLRPGSHLDLTPQ
jgi:alkaline phosphatase D